MTHEVGHWKADLILCGRKWEMTEMYYLLKAVKPSTMTSSKWEQIIQYVVLPILMEKMF